MTTSSDGRDPSAMVPISDLSPAVRRHFDKIAKALAVKGLAHPAYSICVGLLAMHLAEVERLALALAMHGETYSPRRDLGPAEVRARPEVSLLKRAGRAVRSAMKELTLKADDLANGA